ncbi:MAG: NAD(P)-dependent alcohol dehydrogenase [Candidatus Eremiobacteraeota bacterium]|nr:NAD(P)-dependent alcohol dehydrogenase [Candidatus Eremiobacteraeota bacterium]
MKAYRIFADGMRFDEVPQPEPRDDEVLIEVAGCGACHSDLHVEGAAAAGKLPWQLPFTLGHEITGRIVAFAGKPPGFLSPGDAVAVYCAWGCGECAACKRGSDNYCERFRTLRGIGLGLDGGMASHVVVPSARYLVPLGDLDPIEAAPLADAGITAYHAVARSRRALGEGATALVIGVGGLGHLGIQILHALGGCRIVALDLSDEKLALARELGADAALRSDDPGILERVREAAGGRSADIVLDFVGVQSTMDIARKSVRPDGEVALVGLGGGAVPVRQLSVPYGARFSIPFYGSIEDLRETLALAAAGRIKAHVTRYALDDVAHAFTAMRAGTLEGRAVICPGG